MPATNACPECGSAVPPDAPAGLCPRCLLMGAAESATAAHVRPAQASGSPPGGPAVDLAGFVRAVRELGLVEEADLAPEAGASEGDPTRLARALIRAGRLTPYQAGAILGGKARGLAIGPYRVAEKLGVGGMGVVFKAEHRPSGRLVALKILPPSFGRDPDAVRRFRREFEIASRLNHPNLVAAIEASEDRGVHYLTMEYIPGYDLERLVRDGGPLPLKLALHCTVQVARGLEAAHTQGVVHRDVKPGNVMIDPAGSVRVLDLGLARVLEASGLFGRTAAGTLTQTGSYMGTVDFLAPEQADDAKRADHRADIYSLGCTLFYLLVGRPPFEGETVLKRLMAHQERPAPSLRAARPEVPEALEAAYLRMMAKRPADRPQTISEVLLALESCRASAREAGDASADLKTFAGTVLKRAAPRGRRGPDASVFARPVTARGTPVDPDLRLEDLVGDYRDEAGHGELDEDQLPPRPPRLRPARAARGRSDETIALAAFGLVALLVLGYVLVGLLGRSAPKAPAEVALSSPPAPPRPAAPPPEPEPEPEAKPAAEPGPEPVPRAEPEPAEPAARRREAAVLYAEDFDAPNDSWMQVSAQQAEGPDGVFSFREGAYTVQSSGSREWGATLPAGPFDAFEMEVAVRVVNVRNADPRNGALIQIHALRQGQPGGDRGIQFRLDHYGRLTLGPSFFTQNEFPLGPWFGPQGFPAVDRGSKLNRLTFRVRKREIEVLGNGVSLGDPIRFDWDLLPAGILLGCDSWAGTTRAEFDEVVIRELLDDDPPTAP